jgi:hypothetical protein
MAVSRKEKVIDFGNGPIEPEQIRRVMEHTGCDDPIEVALQVDMINVQMRNLIGSEKVEMEAEEETEVYQSASYSDNLTFDHMVLYEDENWPTNQLMTMIKMLLSGKNIHVIAQTLKKSIGHVKTKAESMGIFINDEGRCQYKGRQRTHWNSIQIDFIKWFRDALTCDQMGFLIGRNGNSVHCKFSELD